MTWAALSAQRQLAEKMELSHAYILCGPAGSGKHALAEWMAARYVCGDRNAPPCGACLGCRKAAIGIHPDIIRVGAGREAVSAADVRALCADAYVRPNESPRKVYILERAQELNSSAQNALLKVLEEGPPYAAFLLLAQNELALLPTIRSRCETVRLAPERESGEEGEPLREEAGRLIRLLDRGDELEILTFSVSLEKWEREALARLLELTLEGLRDKLKLAKGADARRLLKLSLRLTTLRRACEFNIGAGHLAGWLSACACEG